MDTYMSRSYKDKPYKFRNPEGIVGNNGYDYHSCYGKIEGYSTWLPLAGVKSKKAKKCLLKDDYRYWATGAPGWFVREFMNRPERFKSHRFERKALLADDLEELDPVDCRRKPFVYYY